MPSVAGGARAGANRCGLLLRHVRALRANRALSISSRRSISCVPALLIALCLLPMLAAATETTLLSANFNDKPIGIFSGTGGADVGEPNTDTRADRAANHRGLAWRPCLAL